MFVLKFGQQNESHLKKNYVLCSICKTFINASRENFSLNPRIHTDCVHGAFCYIFYCLSIPNLASCDVSFPSSIVSPPSTTWLPAMAFSLVLITKFLFIRKISSFPLILILTQNDWVLETLRNVLFSSEVRTKFMANTSFTTASHTVSFFSLLSSNVSAFSFHVFSENNCCLFIYGATCKMELLLICLSP